MIGCKQADRLITFPIEVLTELFSQLCDSVSFF